MCAQKAQPCRKLWRSIPTRLPRLPDPGVKVRNAFHSRSSGNSLPSATGQSRTPKPVALWIALATAALKAVLHAEHLTDNFEMILQYSASGAHGAACQGDASVSAVAASEQFEVARFSLSVVSIRRASSRVLRVVRLKDITAWTQPLWLKVA